MEDRITHIVKVALEKVKNEYPMARENEGSSSLQLMKLKRIVQNNKH